MNLEIDQLVLKAVNAVTPDLSILIVSKDLYGRHLKEALNNQQESRKLGYKLSVHLTDYVATAFKVIPETNINFVVFVIDPQNDAQRCIADVNMEISQLNQTLLFGRTCLVRHYGGIQNPIDVSGDIWGLCEQYGLNLLVDNLTVPTSYGSLAAQLIQLMEAACGANTGMPFFTGQCEEPDSGNES